MEFVAGGNHRSPVFGFSVHESRFRLAKFADTREKTPASVGASFGASRWDIYGTIASPMSIQKSSRSGLIVIGSPVAL
jgi:hypothetical protein